MAVLNRNIFLKLTCLTSMPNLVAPASATLLRKNSKISVIRKKILHREITWKIIIFILDFWLNQRVSKKLIV